MEQNYSLDNIHNVTYDIVLEHIEKVLNERDDFCHCNICVIDLIAYVLNNVTPFYTTSLLGSFYPNKRERIENEIDVFVERGIKRIKQHPHHEDYLRLNEKGEILYGEKRIINGDK